MSDASDAVVRRFETSDGQRLHFRHWTAREPRRGLIVGLHGIQSHSGWYTWSSQRLAEAGYEVYFPDRRGSGLNGYRRGHADHGLRLIHDVRQVIRLARDEQGGSSESSLPLTLMAVSWGGKIAAALAALWPDAADRLALLYPGLVPRVRPTALQRRKLALARTFDRRFEGVDIPLTDPALFTQDPEYQQFIAEDPLALHRVTSGFLNAGLDLDRIIHDHGTNIRIPTLLMLCGQDQIIDSHSTARMVAGFGCSRLTILRYQKARHTLEFEPQRNEFLADLIGWLNRET